MNYKAYLTDIAIVGDGMFPSEVRVQCYDSVGRVMEGFFDKQFIKNKRLEVSVLDSNDKEVILMAPQEGFIEWPTQFVMLREDVVMS